MNLKKSFLEFKDNIAIIDNSYTYTYKKIYKKILYIFPKLNKKKCLVLLESSNTVEFIILYVGCLIFKKTPLLVDELIHKEDLAKIINLYKPQYIFLKKKIDFLKYNQINQINNYIILENKNEISYKINNKLALLLSTSGSSGSLKYVRISYINLQDNTKKIIKYLGINKNDRVITTLNPSYSYGLSIINTHLIAGASIILNNNSIITKKFWDLFKLNEPNSINGVPYTYEILSKLGFNKIPITKLRYMTSAGGALKEDLQLQINKYIKNKKILFYSMYGQTEASPRMSFLQPKYFSKKIGSIGQPLEGGKFIIKKKKNNIGEIIYKGKNVSLGYANNFNDLKKGNSNKNILYTGDLGFKDKEGFYFISGRKNREVKIYSNRFNLDEIEKKLKSKKIFCACIKRDEKIIIFSVKSISKVFQVIKKIFNFNPSLFNVIKINKIPLNKKNKTDYNKLNNYEYN